MLIKNVGALRAPPFFMIFIRVGRPILSQVSVDHPLSANEDLESFDRAIGTKTRVPDRHGHKSG